MEDVAQKRKPLERVRVLEMGHLIAGPYGAELLAGFGAAVTKIERPGSGDPLRCWRGMYRGSSLWWSTMSRNKRCITLDLEHPKGQEMVRRMIPHFDVLIENFKPGTIEGWGLGPDQLQAIHPGLIVVRVSGWGLTGPYANRPGYASVAEAMGGLRYTTGYPELPPARNGVSLGDSIAGLHAALGALMALYHRDTGDSGRGQVIDVSLAESVFSLMEATLPEFDKLGRVRERTGARMDGIVPSSTYLSSDSKHVVIAANGDSIFVRLMRVIGREEMAHDPRLAHNNGRVAHAETIDRAIGEWAAERPCAEILDVLNEAGVVCGPIYSIRDIVADPHFAARGMWEDVDLGDGDTVRMPSFVPKLSETPGGTEWAGPALGAHNDAVYRELLGMDDEEMRELTELGVI
ncbi:MAG: CoA transferase [Bryobacteraceae bacterium]|jgi:crotonobetainyl-CoA:carnitine CoA-transferase CaiB-like acyl-CoA transferase